MGRDSGILGIIHLSIPACMYVCAESILNETGPSRGIRLVGIGWDSCSTNVGVELMHHTIAFLCYVRQTIVSKLPIQSVRLFCCVLCSVTYNANAVGSSHSKFSPLPPPPRPPFCRRSARPVLLPKNERRTLRICTACASAAWCGGMAKNSLARCCTVSSRVWRLQQIQGSTIVGQ